MKVIPAIDLIDGKCVRLTQGDYDQKKIYHENPLEMAKKFEYMGLSHLHLVDLDGAKAGKVSNWKVIEKICQQTQLKVDFGGGIKKEEEIKQLLGIGVSQVNLGSIAVKEPEKVYEWIQKFDRETIILSADVKDYEIAINGWQENAHLNILDFIEMYKNHGIAYITCTDINTDGMLSGPNIDLYKDLIARFPGLKITASGGVGSLEDLKTLSKTGVHAVIVGKAIYEGKISLERFII